MYVGWDVSERRDHVTLGKHCNILASSGRQLLQYRPNNEPVLMKVYTSQGEALQAEFVTAGRTRLIENTD